MKEHAETGGPIDLAQLKRRIVRKKPINNHKAVYESVHAGLKPPWVLLEAFMGEVDLLLTYKRHGKEFFKELSSICSQFEKAFADNDLDRLVELYEELEALKLKAAFRPT